MKIIDSGFYRFVDVLPEPGIKKIIWDTYYRIKGVSEGVPALKTGTADFCALCLLEQYGAVFEKEKLLLNSEYYLSIYFAPAPVELVRDRLRECMEQQELGVKWSDFIKVTEFLKKNCSKWYANMEFYNGTENIDYEALWSRYTSAYGILKETLEQARERSEKQGLQLFLKEGDKLSPMELVTDFFSGQEQTFRETYNGFAAYERGKLMSAYEKLRQVPCYTAATQKILSEMERLLGEATKEDWMNLLNRFFELSKDLLEPNDRVFFGDQTEKTEEVTHHFASLGKFEYVMFGNDTSVGKNGKEGMVITTENIYFKGKISGGELPVTEISHFQFNGKMFGNGMTLYTIKGKKYNIPCEIGKNDQLNYLKVLDGLVRLLKTSFRERSLKETDKQNM